MTKRIYESQGKLAVTEAGGLRVCLITEGEGSSARFTRDFFTQDNANALAGSLSFPAHPMDVEHPEHRDPLSAIASIGDTVTIEEHDGKLGFWGEYIPSKSKPQIAEYLAEYGPKLGLSIYQDSDGHADTDGRWVAETLDPNDAYKSVDLVIAAGRGGKFMIKAAESLGLVKEASATAGEKTGVLHMEKDVEERFAALEGSIGKLTEALTSKATAELQASVDDAAVEKAVEARLTDYEGKLVLITEAKLTERQSTELRELAKKGEDITAPLETAKAVLAEAKLLVGASEDEDATTKSGGRIAEAHLGGGSNDKGFSLDGLVPSGFGQV